MNSKATYYRGEFVLHFKLNDPTDDWMYDDKLRRAYNECTGESL